MTINSAYTLDVTFDYVQFFRLFEIRAFSHVLSRKNMSRSRNFSRGAFSRIKSLEQRL